jgi:HEAT repeat protein
MSFFDLFRSKSASTARKQARPTRPGEVRKWAAVLNKNAREHERQDAIDALARIGSRAAAAALLRRFTFETEPSITDREEKESAFRAIVAIGEDALQPVRDYCARSESLTWAVRILREVLDSEAYVDEVLSLLARWETDYVRNPDPKIQLLSALDVVTDRRVPPAIERFLEDVHEPTRFQAVGALLAQGDPDAARPLARALAREEARRTVNRIAEGLSTLMWPVPELDRPALARALPYRYRLDGQGVVVRT